MEKKEIEQRIEAIIEKVRKDERFVGVLLFGSYLKTDSFRDVDICLIPYPGIDLGLSILEYMAEFPKPFDFSNYFSLPLYIRQEAQKGKLLLKKDYDVLFNIFLQTIKDWDLFKPHFETYLEAVRDGI